MGGAPRLRSRAAGRDEDSKNPRVSAPILSGAGKKKETCPRKWCVFVDKLVFYGVCPPIWRFWWIDPGSKAPWAPNGYGLCQVMARQS